jgi:hypothetical protein
MICEFALEPELVATWHDRKEYLFFDEKFGLQTGRIVSAYPKKWKTLVWQAFEKSPYGQDQNAQMKLEALLQHLTQNMVKRQSTFSEIPVWLVRAETEHEDRPFHAIVARENPREKEDVISAEKLVSDGRHSRWKVKTHPPVARKAPELVAAIAPILRLYQHIVFLDPHFDPNTQRFIKPMAAFFQEIWTNRRGVEDPRVEIHTGIDRFFRNYEREQDNYSDEERRVCDNLIKDMHTQLPKIIPTGKKIFIVIWKKRQHGQGFHNRYILTESCGVGFGNGIDQNDDPESKDKDDLYLMDSDKYKERWKEFMGNPPQFDQVTQSFKINGILGG